MKVNEVINTMVEAMAEKIDRLRGELFCKDYEIENLKAENEKLKEENKKLKDDVQDFMNALKAEEYLMDALKGEEVEDA